MKRKDLEKMFPLTEAEIRELKSLGNQIWEDVAHDVLEGNNDTIPRSHVIEIVLDAGRLEELARRSKYVTPAILALFNPKVHLEAYAYLEKLMKETFTYSRYGL